MSYNIGNEKKTVYDRRKRIEREIFQSFLLAEITANFLGKNKIKITKGEIKLINFVGNIK